MSKYTLQFEEPIKKIESQIKDLKEKNYQTKKKTPNFSGKSVPLRKQVGVSHFGDVDMKGCQTGNAQQTLEQRNKISTLNQVTNIDTQDSIGGSNVTKPQNISGLPISLYENSNTNVYGV